MIFNPVEQIKTSMNSWIISSANKLGQYLDTLSSGKLSPTLADPIHLSDELLRIQKELTPTINQPERPADNIWHYYKYLIASYVTYSDRIFLLIKLPLVDSDSSMPLDKVYNLPILTITLANLSNIILMVTIWLSQLTEVMLPYHQSLNSYNVY